jgi:hypothetical protein
LKYRLKKDEGGDEFRLQQKRLEGTEIAKGELWLVIIVRYSYPIEINNDKEDPSVFKSYL